MKRIQNWDCSRPGLNPFDELHRALMDIRRLTEIFKHIAVDGVVDKYEPADTRAAKRAEFKDYASDTWLKWEPALERARSALDGIENLDQEGVDRVSLVRALGALNTTFPPPICDIPDRRPPGDHLSALKYNGDGKSYFPFEKVNEALQAIDKAVDVLMLIAPSKSDGSKPIESDDESNADYRPINSFPFTMHHRIRQAATPKRKTKRVRKRRDLDLIEYSYTDALKWWPSELNQDESAQR